MEQCPDVPARPVRFAVKCDVGGIRGATLVSTEEQLAMAAILLTSGALPTQAQLNKVAAKEIEDATIAA